MAKLFANNKDPDETPNSVASDLGLHCFFVVVFSITLFGVSRLKWVKTSEAI